MDVTVAERQVDTVAQTPKPGAQLNPLETEVIDFFVQLSRLTDHPCKIYNVLAVGAPVPYLGPAASHLTEIIRRQTSFESN